jgi:hypothetical protein
MMGQNFWAWRGAKLYLTKYFGTRILYHRTTVPDQHFPAPYHKLKITLLAHWTHSDSLCLYGLTRICNMADVEINGLAELDIAATRVALSSSSTAQRLARIHVLEEKLKRNGL